MTSQYQPLPPRVGALTMAANDGTTNASVDPNDIAKCALYHYQHNLSRGKPRRSDEWTIYAAIVAHQNSTLQVVSCATGTKCTTVGPEGWVLRDSHAEVMCRRGLVRELLQETAAEGKLQLLEKCEGSFRLRTDTTLHLYVSDSPCGDATIYPVITEEDMKFTGAKLIVHKDKKKSDEYGELLPVHKQSDSDAAEQDGCCVARENAQELGMLRTKSGRSNLPQHLRSTSMSCSDKLLRWCILGLQGSWLPFAVGLSSVVVSRDPNAESLEAQQQALERSICHRRWQVVDELEKCGTKSDFLKDLSAHACSVHVVEEQFPDNKSVSSVIIDDSTQTTTVNETNDTTYGSRKRKRDVTETNDRKQKSPCGVSINWQRSTGESEVVVGARGIRQGKKPKSDSDYIKLASRLSRGALWQLVNDNDDISKVSFRTWKAKQAHPSHDVARNLVLNTRPFQGWLVGNSDFALR